VVAAVESRCLVCESPRLVAEPHSGLEHCPACGFAMTGGGRARRNDLFLEDYYPSYFERGRQWSFEARKRLRWLLATTSPRRLLEVGSAGGFFLREARRAGIDARGVERSPVAASFARLVLGVPVYLARLEELDLGSSFDAVCAFHVLEHTDDPEWFLDRARCALVRGGWLALEVPNIESAAAQRAGSEWCHLQLEHHRWHFSPETLPRLVEEGGFLVVRCDTAFQRHYLSAKARLSRPGIAHLLHDWLDARTVRTRHPRLGEYIRLLARSPE
jgi:SAM-dependent methyltransferase